MTTLVTYPPPGTLGAADNIGGAGALAFLYVPPVAGTVIGAIVGGPGHRLVGGGIGLLAGIDTVIIGAKIIQVSQPPIKGP